MFAILAIQGTANMTFAERLKQLKDEKGWSEREVANRSGITYSTVHSYFLGRNVPSAPNLAKLAKAFGIGIDEFVAGVEWEE